MSYSYVPENFRGRWLTNTHHDKVSSTLDSCTDETICVVGPPRATAQYTSTQLEAMGVVGIYKGKARLKQ